MRKLFHSGCVAALLALLSFTPTQAADYHDNVVIVLDASASMRNNLKGTSMQKMTAAKEALKEVLQSVPPSTHVGLLVFSAKNIKDDWVYPLGPRDEEGMMKAIDQIRPDKGTPLGKYIKRGTDRLLEEREKQFGYGSYRLLVVTDGEAQDTKLVNRYTPEIIARGITMDVIGVGMSSRHTLATKVHSYRAANDPEALKRAIADVFAEVSSQSSSDSGEDAFQLIAPLPIETAAAVIQTLATTGNHPIGQKAPTRPTQVAPKTTTTQPTATAPTPQQQPQSRVAREVHRTPTQQSPVIWTVVKAIVAVGIIGILALILGIVILAKIFGKRKRQ